MSKINTYIVPVLTNYEGLYKLVKSLEKYTEPNYYIFVIDNGGRLELTDEQKDFKEKAKPYVDLWIDPKKNLGFGKSMNQGYKLSTTEFVTFANDDVEIMYKGWWEEIMEKFEADADLGGFNPHSPCNKSASGDRVIQYDYKEDYSEEDVKEMKEVFHSEREYTGCCTFFTICRREMIEEIGLFDESFGLGSGEDYDLCVRASRGGWRIKGGSTTMVWHWWGKTKDNMPKGGDVTQTNYELIAGGNQNMERKWLEHCDKKVGGWSVSGGGGPEIPVDHKENPYKEIGKWWREVPL